MRVLKLNFFFFFSSRRRHTRWNCDWSSDVCSSDLLAATFPAGTVTGAPKRRAMEIIAGEETTARGPYAGAVGYVSFQGDLDFCITIRTAVVQDGRAHVQAGAGIV